MLKGRKLFATQTASSLSTWPCCSGVMSTTSSVEDPVVLHAQPLDKATPVLLRLAANRF
ncbi:hypothetical protein PR003_g23861 [Phytophthora rubi]|uniref:Uncharacterized protein n=1 Tax=Phytophthora rubi TaxID=129364 RepID=A0A6A3HA10_9STRA|nr:hypothetical protein PR001_g28603 [Phytophthora rubi]KAE9018641.1 hypothetical protein PR002_g13049 [Phytophthora rubi]KAE9295991.1 hypothetical protein PR003_g23861 [Phytophthora rubi]